MTIKKRIIKLEQRVSSDARIETKLKDIDEMIEDAERRAAESLNRNESKTSGNGRKHSRI